MNYISKTKYLKYTRTMLLIIDISLANRQKIGLYIYFTLILPEYDYNKKKSMLPYLVYDYAPLA